MPRGIPRSVVKLRRLTHKHYRDWLKAKELQLISEQTKYTKNMKSFQWVESSPRWRLCYVLPGAQSAHPSRLTWGPGYGSGIAGSTWADSKKLWLNHQPTVIIHQSNSERTNNHQPWNSFMDSPSTNQIQPTILIRSSIWSSPARRPTLIVTDQTRARLWCRPQALNFYERVGLTLLLPSPQCIQLIGLTQIKWTLGSRAYPTQGCTELYRSQQLDDHVCPKWWFLKP